MPLTRSDIITSSKQMLSFTWVHDIDNMYRMHHSYLGKGMLSSLHATLVERQVQLVLSSDCYLDFSNSTKITTNTEAIMLSKAYCNSVNLLCLLKGGD